MASAMGTRAALPPQFSLLPPFSSPGRGGSIAGPCERRARRTRYRDTAHDLPPIASKPPARRTSISTGLLEETSAGYVKPSRLQRRSYSASLESTGYQLEAGQPVRRRLDLRLSPLRVVHPPQRLLRRRTSMGLGSLVPPAGFN